MPDSFNNHLVFYRGEKGSSVSFAEVVDSDLERRQFALLGLSAHATEERRNVNFHGCMFWSFKSAYEINRQYATNSLDDI